MFEKGDIMETIRNVDVNRLHDFKNHPFKVEMNTELCELMRSIEKEGVLVPLLVRTNPYGDGYEVISGHRRKEAAIWAGETKVPVVIRELDDDQAVVAMVDSNLHRENLKPSEKAFAYKMKLDAMKHQGKHLDSGALAQVGPKFTDGSQLNEKGNNTSTINSNELLVGLNIYEILYHYYKHDKKEVKETIDWIKKNFIPSVDNAKDVKELMSYEGEVWMKFYADFKYFLPEDFVMNKRVKRPPDNPINALISFGNTLLYTKTISAIYQTHLDQRISFLHEPSEGRFSLSLDISEVFKPVIVFRTIFDMVNNRKLQVEKHFEKNVNYCILNEEGRKIFIQAFEERLENVFLHPSLKRRVSYRTAIKLDCYKLIKSILEEKEFIPFSLKEGL